MAILVFDIGGTRTRAGLFDARHSTLLRSVTAATPNHLDLPQSSFEQLRQELLSLMCRLGAELVDPDAVTEIDVAFAGPIDPAGDVLAAPTIWGAHQTSPYPLGEDMARAWPGARVKVINDVTAAGYRYLRSSEEEFCIVTVSSGIGNKVFANGRALVGRNGSGGELGHLRVDDSASAPVCECGGRGHLGAVSSGRAVLAYARKHAPAGAEVLTSHAGRWRRCTSASGSSDSFSSAASRSPSATLTASSSPRRQMTAAGTPPGIGTRAWNWV